MNEELINNSIFITNLKLNRKIKRILSTINITHDQFIILNVLYQSKKSTLKNIQKETGLDPATSCGIVRRLEKTKLIYKINDISDKRKKILSLTEKGETIFKTGLAILKEFNEYIISNFNENEISDFKRYLKRTEKLTNI
ncbi:MAG: hypothetical protein ACD_79C01078G0008 [uncultured bacterium]|nr:MAG: hypothetical protein ACD_79C01078G0008 [uncultured bacterium]